jgi:hypothetical protein
MHLRHFQRRQRDRELPKCFGFDFHTRFLCGINPGGIYLFGRFPHLLTHLDKSKVITSERVHSIENGTSSVTVTTTTGQTYIGKIPLWDQSRWDLSFRPLSTSLDALWNGFHLLRLRLKIKPEALWKYWLTLVKALPATYACIFGISKGVKAIQVGSIFSAAFHIS